VREHKGGIAYLMDRHFGLLMPRRMPVEFSAVVQTHADASELAIDVDTLWRLFEATYLCPESTAGVGAYQGHQLSQSDSGVATALEVGRPGQREVLLGQGQGPVEATVQALGGQPPLRRTR